MSRLRTIDQKKEDEMTKKETKLTSCITRSNPRSNPRPSQASTSNDQGAVLIADSSRRKKSMSTPKPTKVALVPTVFPSEIIPQHNAARHSQHYGHAPDNSIEDISYYNEAPSPSEFADPPSPVVNSRLVMPSSDRRSSIPKLPRITASQKSLNQPSRPRLNSYNQVHHSSDLLSSDSSCKKPTTPRQLQSVRQQHQDPLQDTSRAMHPSGFVGGALNSRRRRVIRTGYAMNELPVSFTPPVVSFGATATAVSPEPQLHVNPQGSQPKVKHPLKPVNVQEPSDYLRKRSRNTPPHQPAKPSEKIEPVKEVGPGVIKKESTPRKKEEKKIERTIRLDESLEKEHYIVNFKNVKVTAKQKQIINRFRGGVISKLENLTDEMLEDYDNFLLDIDDIKFCRKRQIEEMLQNYSPRTMLIISSAVPKVELLQAAIRPDVLTLVYDFEKDSYVSLYRKIKAILDEYMVDAKTKSIGFVCKGGPGYMYLLQRKPITPVKLLKDNDLLKFWKEIGGLTSKISWDKPSVVHIMESNVAGNKQGEELLTYLEAAMFANRVKVLSPLELEPKGGEMINTYFFPEKFRAWKKRRYPKIRLYRVDDD